ncbi:hypothetical protein QZH41_020255 [Actinostola sp. cb2023]|nr:hypothetical protein QZH41_020255 [Actinostola sp. cb2023]
MKNLEEKGVLNKNTFVKRVSRARKSEHHRSVRYAKTENSALAEHVYVNDRPRRGMGRYESDLQRKQMVSEEMEGGLDQSRGMLPGSTAYFKLDA